MHSRGVNVYSKIKYQAINVLDQGIKKDPFNQTNNESQGAQIQDIYISIK